MLNMKEKKHDCPIKQAVHECALTKLPAMRESDYNKGLSEEELYQMAWECSVEDHISYVESL
jgi:hypothetical protein